MRCPKPGESMILNIFLLIFCFSSVLECKEKKPDAEDEKWKKKDVTDYTDADLERLYEQWEDSDEDPLEEDELPEWKREPPKIDISKLNVNDPESMLKNTKVGRTLMMFATVSGNPTEKETEQITQIWHSGLFNGNLEVQRYVVGSNRALFLLKDGAKSWEVKNFLVNQERCELVTIENKDYPGKGAQKENGTSKKNDESNNKKTSESDIKKSKKTEL